MDSAPSGLDDAYPALDLADAENGHLRLIDDDGRREQAPATPWFESVNVPPRTSCGASLPARAAATSWPSSRGDLRAGQVLRRDGSPAR